MTVAGVVTGAATDAASDAETETETPSGGVVIGCGAANDAALGGGAAHWTK